jgi:hypothetical protein
MWNLRFLCCVEWGEFGLIMCLQVFFNLFALIILTVDPTVCWYACLAPKRWERCVNYDVFRRVFIRGISEWMALGVTLIILMEINTHTSKSHLGIVWIEGPSNQYVPGGVHKRKNLPLYQIAHWFIFYELKLKQSTNWNGFEREGLAHFHLPPTIPLNLKRLNPTNNISWTNHQNAETQVL